MHTIASMKTVFRKYLPRSDGLRRSLELSGKGGERGGEERDGVMNGDLAGGFGIRRQLAKQHRSGNTTQAGRPPGA